MSLIIPANSAAASGGYAVDNSCRFNEASADSLHRATSQTNGSTKWTLSTWIKRSTLGSLDNGGTFMGTYASTSKRSQFAFLDNDKLYWNANNGAGTEGSATTAAVFRDVSAWYHVVLKIDTTQSSQSDRCKIYVNNVEQSLTFSGAMPAQNEANTGMYGSQYIGASFYNTGTDRHFGGYLAETVMIDNSALEPDQFGEFDEDSGIWKPIDVSGLTFGTNGFYCDYKNSSALGNDANGSNNLTVTNLTAIDQSTDTCTNNFATLSPLWNSFNQGDLSEGNVKSSMTSGVYRSNLASFGVSQGKWYWEIKLTQASNMNFHVYGVTDESTNKNIDFKSLTGTTAFNNTTGKMLIDGSEDGSASAVFAQGDIVGIALNMDDKQISIYKNGSALHSNVAMSSTSNVVFPFHIAYTYATYIFEYNFGNPSFTISSGNTDGDGYGNFEYAVPSGYFSLNTKNLAEYG